MKKNTLLLIVWVSCLLGSCLEEIDKENSGFVKAIGKELGSLASKMMINSEGNVMVLGRIERPSFSKQTNGISGLDSQIELVDSGPFIGVYDQEGNLKDMRLYPMLVPEIPTTKIMYDPNFILFTDIIEMDNGGYFVTGAVEFFDLIEPCIPNNPCPVLNVPSSPFYLILDENLNQVGSTVFLNFGQEFIDSGYLYRLKPELAKNSLGEIFVFYKVMNDVDDPSPTSFSFSLMKYNPDGSQAWNEFLDYGFSFSNGWDIIFDSDGNPTIIHTRGALDNSYLTTFDRNTKSIVTTKSLVFRDISDGERAAVDMTEDGGFVMVYSDRNPLYMSVFDGEWNTLKYKIRIDRYALGGAFEGAVETRVHDNHVYALIKYLNEEVETAFLRKYTMEGDIVWEREFNGNPMDIEITETGQVLLLYNPVLTGIFPKATLVKLNADGNYY